MSWVSGPHLRTTGIRKSRDERAFRVVEISTHALDDLHHISNMGLGYIAGDSGERPLMINSPARAIGAFHIFLCCLTLTGAADAAGPVIGWGSGRPPDAVNGVGGTAIDIGAGFHHSCAI